MHRALVELFNYRALLRYLVILDLKVRYRGSVLGFLWTLLNPLLLMIVLSAVFSRIGRISEENYALFLLSALMTWGFFSQSVERSLGSIIQNRALIQKIYLPKIVFPVSIVLSNLVNLIFFLVAYLLIAVVIYRVYPTTFLLLPVVVMLFFLSAGAAMLMCTLNVFFRDFTHLTSVLLRALFYLTPIIYPASLFGPKGQLLLRLNPAYYPVAIGRDVLYYGRISSLEDWGIGFAAAVLVFVVGLLVFTSTQRRFVYYA